MPALEEFQRQVEQSKRMQDLFRASMSAAEDIQRQREQFQQMQEQLRKRFLP